MVGRRYRDVLETSNTIKFLTQISNDLNVVLTKDRPTFATPADVEPVKIDERSKNLILFNSILNMVKLN
jgi:hypothetical protein